MALELVPHLDHPISEVTKVVFCMVRGRLRMKLRAALVEYIPRRWVMDSSPNGRLRSRESRLWLYNPRAPYGVTNAVLAPGYRSSDKNTGEQ